MSKHPETEKESTKFFVCNKLVLFLLACSILLLFTASFVFRMKNPSLKNHPGRAGEIDIGSEQENQALMQEIFALMDRAKKEPDNLPLLVTLADRFMLMEAFDRAFYYLEKAEYLVPDDPSVLLKSGICLYRTGHPDKAVMKFEKVLGKHPGNHAAKFHLALTLKFYLHDVDKGNELFQSIIDDPEMEKHLKNLAKEALKTLPKESSAKEKNKKINAMSVEKQIVRDKALIDKSSGE